MAAILSVAAEHGGPRYQIRCGNAIEHLLSATQRPAARVHGKEAVCHKEVRIYVAHLRSGAVDLPSKSEVPDCRAGAQHDGYINFSAVEKVTAESSPPLSFHLSPADLAGLCEYSSGAFFLFYWRITLLTIPARMVLPGPFGADPAFHHRGQCACDPQRTRNVHHNDDDQRHR